MLSTEKPKFLLVVIVPKGLIIRDLPRPQSEGARERRTVPVGTELDAYSIHNISGVPYARLVPQNPQKPEWVRVREADGSIEYVDVIDLQDEETGGLAQAIRLLAQALISLKS